MRVAFPAFLVMACGGEPPPRQPKPPPMIDVPEVVVPARSCPTKYTPDNATPASVEQASAGMVIIAARGQLDKLRGYVFAHGAEAIAVALETGVTDHAASLRATVDRVPSGCQPAWFVERRIEIQPAFIDTPPDRAAAIAAGLDELAATTQLVGTCGGCPAIAIAFTSTTPPLVSAWLVP